MMKQSFSSLLGLLFLAAPATVQAQDYLYSTNADGITCTINKYFGPVGALTIPSTLNGMLVTSIGEDAFDGNLLTSVTIPNSVTSIGVDAFGGCVNLTSVSIPNSVTTIGDGAFLGCGSLSGVTIPNSVTSIGGSAFAYSGLTNVTIPGSVTDIGLWSFEKCTNLTAITVDANNPTYTSVAGVLIDMSQAMLFQYPPASLTGSYTIPESVTTIGNSAFQSCANLASVTIPDSVTTILDNAFQGCGSLTIVTIGTNVGSAYGYGIEYAAFSACTNLTGVYFQGDAPSANTDAEVFYNDTNATAYYLPGTSGWGGTYCGIPAVLSVPKSLQVTISPTSAIVAGAQWRVDGGTLLNSGATVTNLSVGNHTVSFRATSGWTTPINQTVSVSPNSMATAIGIYGWQTGALQVTMSPLSAAITGAQWRVDGGTWQNSGATVGNLPVGNHTLNFSTIGRWSTPSNQVVTILGGIATASGVYASQAFTNLYSFNCINDGGNPIGLIISGNTLYGTTLKTIFKINTDGTDFQTLHSFTPLSDGSYGTNSDGATPSAIIVSGNTLYGTTVQGGASGWGTIFKVNTNGTGFTNLHAFTNGSDGADPSSLLLTGGSLVGATSLGGNSDVGVLFHVNTNGTGFTSLFGLTVDDGAGSSGWILSGNTLFATSTGGGYFGDGSVFAVNTNGTGLTILNTFYNPGLIYNNGVSYSVDPSGQLILSGNNLYGTTRQGGIPGVLDTQGSGMVFAATTNGSGSTWLYQFTGLNYSYVYDGEDGTNDDGANPYGGLVLSGNTIYGTTANGGYCGVGVVFAVNTNGTGFNVLYTFAGPPAPRYVVNGDGANPYGGLVSSGNTLYGTTLNGGNYGGGMIFSLSLGSSSSIARASLSGGNLVLNGINGQSGGTYYVLTSTNLALPLSHWTRVATNILSANGNFSITVTNTVTTGIRQSFYILETQ